MSSQISKLVQELERPMLSVQEVLQMLKRFRETDPSQSEIDLVRKEIDAWPRKKKVRFEAPKFKGRCP